MLALSPASFNGYKTADETGLPAGNTFLVDSPLNRALGASGGARRRRRSARKAAKNGGSRKAYNNNGGSRKAYNNNGGSRKHRRAAKNGGTLEGGKSRRHRKSHRKTRRGHRRANN